MYKVTPLNYYSDNPENPYRYKRQEHQLDPVAWYVERWGGDAKHILWDMYPGYEDHEWDGTANPLFAIWDSIAMQQNVSASSATSMGKTYLASLIVFWFLDVYPNALVVTTSTKFSQLKQTLWKEMKKHFKKFKRFYPNAEYSDKLQIKFETEELGDEPDQRLAFGTTEQTSSGEEVSVSAAGQHAENMLIILDEGSGIPKSILEAYINTATAANNIICMLGNPVSQLDSLYYFSNKKNVKSVRISAYDHPNYINKKEIIPGAVTFKSVSERLIEYGENHPLYLARVRGISPSEGKDSLLKIANIEAIYNKVFDPEDEKDEAVLKEIQGFEKDISIGVDVANSVNGDKAAVARFEGNVLNYLKDFECPDANAIASNMVYDETQLEELINSYSDGKDRYYDILNMNVDGFTEEDVIVDVVGVGVGTINEFSRLGHYVESFAGGDRPDEDLIPEDEEGEPLYSFHNLRSQSFYMLMDDILKKKISFQIPEEVFNRLALELASFKMDKQSFGRGFKLESKSLTKKRIAGNSPNLADAVIMANLLRRKKLHTGGFLGVYI